MGVIGRILSIHGRHWRGMRRYENGGAGVRIFTLFLMFAFAALAIGMVFVTKYSFQNNILVGILVAILTIGVGASAIEFCGVYSFVGFKMAIVGTIYKIADIIDKKKKKKAIENGEAVPSAPTAAELAKEKEIKESHRYKVFDFFIGILGLILSIGTIIGMIASLIYVLNH